MGRRKNHRIYVPVGSTVNLDGTDYMCYEHEINIDAPCDDCDLYEHRRLCRKVECSCLSRKDNLDTIFRRIETKEKDSGLKEKDRVLRMTVPAPVEVPVGQRVCVNGIDAVCVEGTDYCTDCVNCVFSGRAEDEPHICSFLKCAKGSRKDHKSVLFIKEVQEERKEQEEQAYGTIKIDGDSYPLLTVTKNMRSLEPAVGDVILVDNTLIQCCMIPEQEQNACQECILSHRICSMFKCDGRYRKDKTDVYFREVQL